MLLRGEESDGRHSFTRQGYNQWTGRRVTEIKTLLIMLYNEMAHIVHDKRATYSHSGNMCLKRVASSILVCYVLLKPSTLPRVKDCMIRWPSRPSMTDSCPLGD